jgi:acetyl-CoA C-acetyltransferase
MQAIDSAIANIQCGRSELVLAGGVDALSRAPLLYSDAMVRWFAGMMGLRTVGQKLGIFEIAPGHLLTPVIGLMKGLTDPVVGLLMGQTAENLAWKFGISRQQMDEFAVRSHQRAWPAGGRAFGEIVPVVDGRAFYAEDDGVRADASMAGMAKLKPFFDKKYGNITAANSSQITDGAAWVLLASEEAVQKWGLKPIGKIVDSEWAGLEPAQMGLGPVHAATPILQRHGLGLNDIDYWELNEAFAAQVLAARRPGRTMPTAASSSTCRARWANGRRPPERRWRRGAVGHPVGASGARIVLHLLHVLRRNQARRGIATICIGGGLGGAMLGEPELTCGSVSLSIPPATCRVNFWTSTAC